MITTDRGAVLDFVSFVKNGDQRVGFDTETDGTKPGEGDRIVAFSLYHPDRGSLFVPVRMLGLFADNAPESVISDLEPLTDGTVRMVGHNLVFDLAMLMAEGHDIRRASVFDTQYGAFLLDDSRPSYALKGERGLGWNVLRDPEALDQNDPLNRWLANPKNKPKPWSMAPVEALGFRAEKDARLAWGLYDHLRSALWDLYGDNGLVELEMRWVRLLARLTMTGVMHDMDRSREIEQVHVQRMSQLSIDLAAKGFTPSSPKKLLGKFRELGLIDPRTHAPLEDTEEITLHLVKDDLPEVGDILEARQRANCLSARILPYRKHAKAGGGRVFGSWGATGYKSHSADAAQQGSTRTGRLRASKPNLTGVPVYDPEIHREKEVFVAPPGWKLAAMDLSQADIRVAAHYIGDQRLIEELSSPDGDLHTMISKETGIERTRAKRVVFGAGLYGAGDEKAAETLTEELKEYVSPAEARRLKGIFHSKYPLFRKTMNQVVRMAKRRGYITTWDGRRLTLGPGDLAHKFWNYLIQAGVAAIVKQWMDRMDDVIQEHGWRMRFILQVHDEIVLEYPEQEERHLWQLKETLNGIGPEGGFKVPLFASIKTGVRWSHMTLLKGAR